MNEKKWTPGPWGCDERVGCVAVYAGERVNCLADAADWAVHFTSGRQILDAKGNTCWEMPKEKLANACLIAAAPELYEAMEKMLGRLKTVSAIFSDHSALADVLREYEAAMAKARGEKE